MPETISYWRRWCAKAKDQTFLFAKQRLIFGCCMAIVTAVALWAFGKSAVTLAALGRTVAIFVGSYLFVFTMSFVVNMFRAPALLDEERVREIDGLTGVVQTQALAIKDKSKQKELQGQFANFMHEGKDLADKLLSMPHFGPWLIERGSWINRVSQALVDIDLPVDAAAFKHSGESSPELKGVANDAYWQRFYSEQLTLYRASLKNIAERRLG